MRWFIIILSLMFNAMLWHQNNVSIEWIKYYAHQPEKIKYVAIGANETENLVLYDQKAMDEYCYADYGPRCKEAIEYQTKGCN